MNRTDSSTGFFFDDGAETLAFEFEAVIINDFLRMRSEDRARGREGELADYQERFLGFESLIAREWDVEHRTEAATMRALTGAAGVPDSPRKIGRYEIWGFLRQGGMGRVYRAFDPSLRRDVVVKTLRSDIANDPEMRQRFEREARATSNFQHDGICPALDFFEEDGAFYVVLAFIDGRPLNDIVKDARKSTRSTPSARIAALLSSPPRTEDDSSITAKTRFLERRPGPVACALLVERLARAVHAAHEHGIVHRDIKPGNVMVRADGSPVVLDFGLAREFEGGVSDLTSSGDVLGTPNYMAPEQASGDVAAIGPATDVYALGVVLFQLLTLELPFEAHDRRLQRDMILHAEPKRLRNLDPTIPRDLEAICHKAIAREPSRRYPTALALAEDLERFRRLEPVSASRVTSLGRLVRTMRRDPRLVVLAIVFVLALVALRLLSSGEKRGAVDRLRSEQRLIEGVTRGTVTDDEWRRLLTIARTEGVEDELLRLRENPNDREAHTRLREVTFERAMRGHDGTRLVEPRYGVATRQPVLRFHDWVNERSPGRELAYEIEILDLATFSDPIRFTARSPAVIDDIVIVPLPEDVTLEAGSTYAWSVLPMFVRHDGSTRSLGLRPARQSLRVVPAAVRDAALARLRDIPAHLRPHQEALALAELGLLADALAVLGETLPESEGDEESMRSHVVKRIIARETNRLLEAR